MADNKTLIKYPTGETQYRIPFDYLARSFVKVSLEVSTDSTLSYPLTPGNDYRFLNATTIEILIPQGSYDVLQIRRFTDTTPLVGFRDGSVLTANDLTVSELQAIHIAEEGRDQTLELTESYVESAANIRDEVKELLEEMRDDLIIQRVYKDSFEKGQTLNLPGESLRLEATNIYYEWTGSFPKVVPAGSTPDTTGGVTAGAWRMVGNSNMEAFMLSGSYHVFSTIDDMKSLKINPSVTVNMQVGSRAMTLKLVQAAGKFYNKRVYWDIVAAENPNTLSVQLVNGLWAAMVVEDELYPAVFGWGEKDDPAANAAAYHRACAVAEANPNVHTIRLHAGAFRSDGIVAQVARRRFRFTGAGWDNTFILSESSDISFHHKGFNESNPALDKRYFQQIVDGFTVDGQMGTRKVQAAQRTLSTVHYAELGYKSVNHRVSQVDICGLVVKWYGMTGAGVYDGVWSQHGLRVRYNSIKLNGYIGGAPNQINTMIGGFRTKLIAPAKAGDTTIQVENLRNGQTYDIIEVGGGTLEAPRIKSRTGNTITLFAPLEYDHTVNAVVRLPVVGTEVQGTLEVGIIYIADAEATTVHGIYSEESKFYLSGLLQGCEIHGNSIAEANPTVQVDSNVDPRSHIRIVSNNTYFPVTIAVADETGAVNNRLDLKRFPNIEIKGNTRAQNSIWVNGVYSFSSLRVYRTYDSGMSDVSMTTMEFDGLSAQLAAGAVSDALNLASFPATRPYKWDGYTFDLTATYRRVGKMGGGTLKRAGHALTDGTTHDVNVQRYVSTGSTWSEAGVDLLFGVTGTRASVTARGEASGAWPTSMSIRGIITHAN